MLKKAKDYVTNNTFLACSNVINLPFSDDSFDLVFTHGTLMHVSSDDLEKAVLELKRVTRKDLIIIEEVLWDNTEQSKKISQLNEYTFIYDYKKIIESSGLTIQDIKKHDDLIELICIHCQKV
jgi:ubiquinone/menaquinone biosynthesis C-methylase UbiE